MTDALHSPEVTKSSKPDLVKYDDDYTLEITKTGTEVSFNTLVSGKRDRDSQAFDTLSEIGTMVGLECTGDDGRVILIGGTAFGDLVCELTPVEGKTRFKLFNNPGFNTALAERPMTIGSRPDRLNGMKLTKVIALPQTGIIDGSETRAAKGGVRSPLALASDLMKQHLGIE